MAGAVGSTIQPCPGCPSQQAWEVQAAFDEGLNVEIASDSVWFSKSTADFQSYSALVFGDGRFTSTTAGNALQSLILPLRDCVTAVPSVGHMNLCAQRP